MVNGSDEMGVRGSICDSYFIVGVGAPGGVSAPWAKTVESRALIMVSSSSAQRMKVEPRVFIFRLLFGNRFLN